MNKSWTHAICLDCWNERNPDKAPVYVGNFGEELCCFCTKSTSSGIYVREDPKRVLCRGKHE